MTTFVAGAFDEAVLAPFGRRIIVRECQPGVSMVDVLGVAPADVAGVLREVGAHVLDGAPPAPEPVADSTSANHGPAATALPLPVVIPPPVCAATACRATACGATPCDADNGPVLAAVRDARDDVLAAMPTTIAAPTGAKAVVDLAPVLESLSALRADVELLERPGDVVATVPADPGAVSRRLQWRPWLGGAGAAFAVELVARLH